MQAHICSSCFSHSCSDQFTGVGISSNYSRIQFFVKTSQQEHYDLLLKSFGMIRLWRLSCDIATKSIPQQLDDMTTPVI